MMVSANLLILLCSCLVLHLAAKQVTSPPRFILRTEKEIAYKVGERVELPCKASADPEPTYTWEKNGEPLDITGPDFQREPGTGTVIIPEPLTRHEGIYQCFAKNMYGTALGLKIMLKKATLSPFPTMTEPKVHRPVIGEPLVLRCNPPFSYPNGILYWAESKPGAKISAIDNTKRVSQDFEGNLYFTNVEAQDKTDGDGYVCIVNNEILRSLSKGDDEEIYPVSSPGNLHISNIVRNDSRNGEKYVCITQNNILRSLVKGFDQKIEPQSAPTEPPKYMAPSLMWSSDPMTIAIKGENLHLKCIFAGFPTPTVEWRRLDAPMPSKVEHKSFGQEIVIKEIDHTDTGEYECFATQPSLSDPVRKQFIVHVESMPFWIISPEDVNSSEEENAEFHCQAGGVPNPDVMWSINGIPINDMPVDPRRSVTKTSVIYHNLTKTDAQVLQCNATNKHGYIFTNAFLNVLAEPPSFIEAPKSVVKAAEVQDITLKCRTFGAPKPVITWTKNGQEITDNKFKVKKNGDLKIKGVLHSDLGTYKCHAWNKFGEIEALGQLLVRDRTVILQGPQSQDVNATANVIFNCQATTDPTEESKLRIEWKRNGEMIAYEQEGRIAKNMADNSLIINQVVVGDSGEYTCVASNGLDSDEVTAQLTVKDRPDPPTGIALLSCSTTRAELMWEPGSDNNDKVLEYIVYYNTSFDEPGQYHEADARTLAEFQREIHLSPWAGYTFHVRARNSIGMSSRSHQSTTVCRTPPSAPSSSPRGVCTESRDPNDLVIVWEPMPEIEHNGDGFKYLVNYQPLGGADTEIITMEITDWHKTELVVRDVGTYKEYLISVQAANSMGTSPPSSRKVKKVHSGEDTPLDQPGNFWMDESTLNATSAKFMWDPVDPSPSRVRGFFRGYQIQFWRTDRQEDIRTHDVILANYDPCPEYYETVRFRRDVSQESTHVMNLWPFSRITAGALVLNGAKKGSLGETIEFTTPEGVPGAVPSMKVVERGSHHFRVKWHSPVEPNGIIIGYVVGIRRASGHDSMREKTIMDPTRLSTKIRRLEPDTYYTVFVWALTSKGRGDVFFIEDSTLEATEPDVPGFAQIESGENYINVSWVPTADGPTRNPGSEFFVEYRQAGASDDETWEQTRLETEHNWANITNLTPGESYEVRVVAVNGGGETTRSTTKVVKIGPSDVTTLKSSEFYIILDEANDTATSVYIDDDSMYMQEPVVQNIATAGWFVGMMCAIIFLLIILLIICIIKRNRGGKYPVHEKEKLRGRDPDKEDEEGGFGEYTRTPYKELPSDEPEYKKSQGSIESEDKPLESESNSLAEYEDTDPMKFNEDGSFIGMYGGKNHRPEEKPLMQNDSTQPSALSTFV